MFLDPGAGRRPPTASGRARASWLASLDLLAARLGQDGRRIPVSMSFREWCEDLGRKGLLVDRRPFKLEDRPALIPIYEAIPTTLEEAVRRMLVVQKATQIGLTVWEVMATIYMAKKFGPITIGSFLPSQMAASTKSEVRFMPILRSAPLLYQDLIHREDPDGSITRVGEGNVFRRNFLQSLLLWLWTSGKVTTESMPMDMVTMDEVQGMTLDQIDKVLARMGASKFRYAMLLSTAYMPDLDINAWYQRGTMEVWHTRCERCGAESDLSDPAGTFPHRSIGYNAGEVPGVAPLEYFWRCPACQQPIADPQVGRYVQTNFDPERKKEIRSFLLPRTISPDITPREMFQDFQFAKTGAQKQSFFNRTLARPYIDPEQIPVTLERCEAAVKAGSAAGVTWLDKGQGFYMGIDQMGGWCAVIIKRRLPDGRQAVAHVAAYYPDDSDFWTLCDGLMERYGVSLCVVEQLPDANGARRFCNRHPGRAFMVTAQNLKDDMIAWGDSLTTSDKRTAKEDRSRYSVQINQYQMMQAALFRIRDTLCLFPNPDELEATYVDEKGVGRRAPLLREVFHHFTKTALVVKHDPDKRKPVAHVQKLKIDPHYSFANMLCDVAWARNHGTSTFVIPGHEPEDEAQQERDRRAAVLAAAGAPPGVAAAAAAAPRAGTCGACHAYVDGRCTARGFTVRATDPSCDIYVPAEQRPS